MRLTLLLLILLAAGAFADTAQVPPADRVDQSVLNYHAATAAIATAGVISEGGLNLLKSLGFKAVLDLRTAAEGTAKEQTDAAALGLGYHNIEIGEESPTADQLAQFKTLVEDNANLPLLIHCASGNRVGVMWAMYRVESGTALDEALNEGRAMGMRPSREVQVVQFAAQPHE